MTFVGPPSLHQKEIVFRKLTWCRLVGMHLHEESAVTTFAISASILRQMDSASWPKCQFISTKPHGILLQKTTSMLPSNLTNTCNICAERLMKSLPPSVRMQARALVLTS